MSTVEEHIRRFIVQRIMFKKDESVLGMDDPILESGIIDSTAILELVGFLEGQYQITITDEDVVPEHFDTVRSISNLVKTKQTTA